MTYGLPNSIVLVCTQDIMCGNSNESLCYDIMHESTQHFQVICTVCMLYILCILKTVPRKLHELHVQYLTTLKYCILALVVYCNLHTQTRVKSLKTYANVCI